MPWLQFTLPVSHELSERWADTLLESGAASVHAEDEDADSIDECPIFGEPGEQPPGRQLPGEQPPAFGWRRTRLTVLVDADRDPATVLMAAAARMEVEPPALGVVDTLADQDWVRASQSQFEPIAIGQRLLIAPSWHAPPAVGDRLTVVVDPGLAFGTGSHPTTRLCLGWIDAHLGDAGEGRAVGSVIDYGCGSGILAIAAARLGAADVRAVDVDPQAVASARFNAARNGVTVAVDLPDRIDLVPADVVLANILSNPLKLLAPLLSGLVAPGGWLVLSGVLDRQVAEVSRAYAGRIALAVWRSAEGWACLAGQRSG
ncbi:MAG: 50S ribosomal protein L11 methyltransferase [Burkholderiaceae bacterium]